MHLYVSLFALAYLTSEVGKQDILAFEAVRGVGEWAMASARLGSQETAYWGDEPFLEQLTF